MKIIYRIPKGQSVSTSNGVKFINTENRNFVYETEQVPENFEEVKQLVKEHIELLGLNKDVWEIDIQKDFIDIQKKYVTYRVRFTSIGNILFDAYLKIAENKTPNELWMGIKSLIGEQIKEVE